MRLFSREKPKIKVQTNKKDGFSGWLKCSNCKELIHNQELEKSHNCCPKCSHHYKMGLQARIASLTDTGSFKELFTDLKTVDALGFVDTAAYPDRMAKAQAKTGRDEAVCVGSCTINGVPAALGVMDFSFMGASMGSVVGERITLIMEYALQKRLPLVMLCTSGGARMQESVLSLMQMAKTSCAVAKMNEEGIPYITILTNPTSGGVTASFAALGDVILAEPKALICFAGPRVIEQTIGEKLPEEAQTAEFLLEHGMVDQVVERPELKKVLFEILDSLPIPHK